MKWDSVLTVVLVGCAVVTTGLVIRREFFASPPPPQQAAAEKPVLLDNWRVHLSKGTRMGPEQAPVQLIEFADFECPFCSQYHKQLKTIRERYPTQVALTYIHFPLPNHRFAEPAARAAECAGAQGRFEAMNDTLFDQQNAFGLKPWTDLAAEAGVPDRTAFEICMANPAAVPVIDQGRQLGRELNIRGTPTLIVNGWKVGPPPDGPELDRMVQAVLAGKSPVSVKK